MLEMLETRVQSLVQEDPLKEGMATHSSVLAWRIPWTKEPGKVPFIGLQSQTHDLACTYARPAYMGKNKSIPQYVPLPSLSSFLPSSVPPSPLPSFPLFFFFPLKKHLSKAQYMPDSMVGIAIHPPTSLYSNLGDICSFLLETDRTSGLV